MNVRRVVAILVLATLAVVMPSSASASIASTPETRIGNFELREPVLVGFAVTRTVENHRSRSILCADLASQHSLRWKGMWRFDLGGGDELYDARARMWSPALGTFLSVDEFAFHDAKSTLWGWPGQNSIRWRDPSGRIGMGDSASSDRAIGSAQNWGDSSFQTGLKDSAVFDAFALAQLTPLGYLLDAGLFVASDKDLPLLGLMGAPRVGGEAAAEAALEGGSCPASTPVGRRGSPLTVPRGTNAPANIGGTQYTGHALDQMQARGLTPSVVEDTLARGAPSSGYDGATVYTTEQARVVVNPDGSIKTAMPFSL